jgi:2-dehydro-3-deoxyphosphogluconate aldolase/(4S)-4-hydroxy-2-oxoglutarate aldolase
MKRYRIMLADDHRLFRLGLKKILAENNDLEVVGEVGDALELIRLLPKLNPQMVMLDVSMPNLRGIEAIPEIKRICPGVKVLILTMHNDSEYLFEAIAAGARFIVSPGMDAVLIRHCQERQVPIIPGACTPTEIQMAIEAGLTTVKLFPAEPAGGIPYLRALGAPFAGIRFVPTGGIDATNLGAYLALPNVVACGGSWLVRRELLARGDWAAVRRLASEAAAIVRDARAG